MQLHRINELWPLPKRQQFIKKLLDTKTGPTYPLYFQGYLRDFIIHLVSVDMPVYRLSNGRTLALQQEYIAKNNKPEDFFSGDPESIQALIAQEEILKSLPDKADLLTYFRSHEQNEPLILTQDGHVVNGNRRLCAMRILLSEDPDMYKKFAHIRVIVLPQCTETDIDVLEAQLQIQPDIKLKYSWVDQAMLLRDRQRIHNWTIGELARVHDLSEKEVRRKIDLLAFGDQYLDERGWAREYSRILDKEYAFAEIQKKRNNFATEEERDGFTQLAYIQLDQPSQSGRRYEVIPEIAENYSNIIKEIHEQIADQVSQQDSENLVNSRGRQEIEDDQLALWDADSLLGVEDSQELTDVLSIFARPEKHSQIRDITRDIIEASRQEKRSRKSGDYCLKQVIDAKKSLSSSYEQLSVDANLQGIETHLATIEDLVRKVRTWLEENK